MAAPSRQLINIGDLTNMMDRMHKFAITCQNLLSDEQGQDMVEYALVLGLVALGATAAMTTLAGTIGSAFTTVGASLTSAVA